MANLQSNIDPFALPLNTAGVAPNYDAYYINLNRSTERRASVESQLETYGLSNYYRRFPAVDGSSLPPRSSPLTPSELGCFMSHYQALAQASGRGKCVHILEDDVLLSEYMVPLINAAIASSLFDQFDVVFTDSLAWPSILMLKTYLDFIAQFKSIDRSARAAIHFQVLALGEINFSCASSYIVSNKAIDRLVNYYKEEFDIGPTVNADLLIRNLTVQRNLRVGCFFPFTTSIRLDQIGDNTIKGRTDQVSNPAVLLMSVLRYSFFINSDLKKARRLIRDAPKRQIKLDPHRELVAEISHLLLTTDARMF
jgi:GR25 family glycosyltransferase involved in LPS biosynthesis